ncbi:MAG TPA: thiamine-phosphate kinase [Rhodocyclaceae bacterium]
MASEFELIDRYFRRATHHTALGVGDDGAIVRPSPGMEIVISTDMLVAGTHFLPNADPGDLGWKTLAVNVSDMAAMGAAPRWALLAAALPAATETWVAAFAKSFFECADAFGVDVIGGDTTRGPRNFCVTIFGEVPQGQALLRSGARPGDEIWVSGSPGLAALGLAHLQGRCLLAEPALTACLSALQRPQPRVALGLALRGVASAAIDVSDGLLADLGHILEESNAAARVEVERLPGDAFACGATADLARDCLLAGGDDYELVFTAPAARHEEIERISADLRLALTCIGSIEGGKAGDLALLEGGRPVEALHRGFDHFGG